ncbi:YadA-like family protein [Burkholderia cepacia]|uniref:YadA-like family protein n=1 Tax=Burkholderia cepacia TaxID=292 RepID=UPI001CF3E0B8|nr:YadA-like family protein [Burkholderia cepacia]MCA8318575.1 YadA-like family protein [Burkholderia cepacia]
MNKMYCALWSEALGAWVAVQENGKVGRRGRHVVVLLSVAAVGVMAAPLVEAQTTVSGSVNNGNAGQAASTDWPCRAVFVSRNNPGNPPPNSSPFMLRNGCSTAVGDNASATEGGTAVGDRAYANGGVALGVGASSMQNSSIAIGPVSLSSGNTSIAIGRQAAATADYATAIGNVAYASGISGIAMGDSALASGYRSVAIGSADTDGAGNDGVSAGANYDANTQTRASGARSLALGAGAVAAPDDSIALGANSVGASNAQGPAAFSGDVVPAGGAVSVGVTGGERQIKNIAGGTSGTDAVNVNQLAAVSDSAVKYDKNSDGSINSNSVTLNPRGSSATRLTNVAAGDLSANSVDTVNGSQLYQTNQIVSALGNDTAAVIGGGAIYKPATGQLTRPTFNIAGGTQTTLSDAIIALNQGWYVTTGGNASGTSVTAVSPGSTVTYNGGKNISLIQDGAQITIATNDIATFSSIAIENGGPKLSGTEFNMVGQKITNVAPGNVSANSMDAVTGSQLYQVQQAQQQTTTDQTVKYGKNSDGSINFNSVTLSGTPSMDGGKTGGTKFSNLAQGNLSENSTDAVNGAQLYRTNQSVANLGQQVANIADGGGIKYFHANSGGTNSLPDSVASGAGSMALGPGATATDDNSVAIGDNAIAKRGGDVALGSGSTADRGGEKYTGKYSGAVNNTAGTVSVGAPRQWRTISNVADGKEETDAVNLRQLDGAVQAANTYTNQQLQDVQGSVSNVTTTVHQLQGDMSSVKAGSAGMFQTSRDGAMAPHASGNQSTAGGVGATASGNRSTALGNGARASGTDSVALGAHAQASGSNSTALGTGSVADRNNSISIGSVGHERQITNIAPGTASTDAVNLGQLNAAINQTAGQLQQGINDTARKAYSGVAAATALTMIPDVDKDKVLSVGVGVGSYQGYSAIALGATARITENVKMRAGASLGGSATAIGMGASMQW